MVIDCELSEPVLFSTLHNIFSPLSLRERYNLDEQLFMLKKGGLFYYFGIVETHPFTVQLLATSSTNIFDTESR